MSTLGHSQYISVRVIMIFRKPGTIIPPSNWIQFTLTVHQSHCQRKLYYNVALLYWSAKKSCVRFFLFCLFSCMFLFVCVCVCVRVRACARDQEFLSCWENSSVVFHCVSQVTEEHFTSFKSLILFSCFTEKKQKVAMIMAGNYKEN